nr:immunoglobulin heavy chain junction region [Homo sapiens]MBN4555409.1 immunoglobulin heavy chain junction region [Homo sapiens]
LCDLSPGPL